jgi:tetratricopeptide (TPR) repeat protein
VEGRIRGRLAPDRGIKPQNITTSGEVYQIFADARAEVHRRDPEGFKRGIALLRKAVAMDPNYAPAWAELGIATRLAGGPKPIDQLTAEAASYLKRALTLAPNLANARAALPMVEDYPPGSEAELRKALALDPNDAEAWLWLGSLYANQ